MLAFRNSYRVVMAWSGQASGLCPKVCGSHAFFTVQRWQQVFLAKEFQRKVDEQPSDGLQLLCSPRRVCVAERFLAAVVSQQIHVVNAVAWEAFKNLTEKKNSN